mgnify:CR=1 FL=1
MIAALVSLSLAAVACGRLAEGDPKASDGNAKAVATTLVVKNSVRRSVDVVGTLAAVDQVTISSEAEGTVRAILADLGDRVAAEPGARFSSTTKSSNTRYEQQQAALARRSRSAARRTPSTCRQSSRRPTCRRRRRNSIRRSRASTRAKELSSRSLISQQTYDDARTALQSKQASYDSALQSARNLRASIQASEATMKLAGRQLRDTDIRAPFDGYVERRLVNLGELVKVQMPVMAHRAAGSAEGDRPRCPRRWPRGSDDGRPVELRVDAYRDRTFTGKVTRISPAVNTATRAFPFEAVVPNPDAVLKPGTFARVHVESGKVDDVLTLPYAALQCATA